jgi:hypothetical protein
MYQERWMKRFLVLMVLYCAALLIAGCALPLGENYTLTREGNFDGDNIDYILEYNLQNYVPIPAVGEQPVVSIDNREDMTINASWEKEDVPGSNMFTPVNSADTFVFQAGTIYRAEIQLSAKTGYAFSDIPFAYLPGKIHDQTIDRGNPVRTVIVTYNNSDDANITYITEYNLQNYVPVPIVGEKPVWTINTRGDLTMELAWEEEDSPGVGTFHPIVDASGAFTFGLSTVYRATIILKAIQPEYRFFRDGYFAYTNGTAVTAVSPTDSDTDLPIDSDIDLYVRKFEVTYRATRTPIIINDFYLTPYITKPASGASPVMSFAASQYTGTVIWTNTETQAVLEGPFLPTTAYTAVATLIPASGYTIDKVGANQFTHTGAAPEDIHNGNNSGVVTIHFPATGTFGSPTVVYDTVLTGRLAKPVSGDTPDMGITGLQYAGSVTWIPFHSTFRYGTPYTAVLVLNAEAGYTFTGIGQNVFSHNDASGIVTNPADSGTVTITFPPTASSSYNVISDFGPVENENSALRLMYDRRSDPYPLEIDLPDNMIEPVDPDSVVLMGGQNSPLTVTINGRHSTLKINSPGTLLTVGGGVTLTLRNITLEGILDNDAPLIKVQTGGKLTLGTGVTLTGNESTGNVGGVAVNGGELVLSGGGRIEKMSAGSSDAGGGVRVDNGKFTINGGIIGGESAADGNSVSGANSGGGVFVNRGILTMNSGTIQSNTAGAEKSGGGVYISDGTFYLYNGVIKANAASYSGSEPDSESGGGVYISTDYEQGQGFFMSGGTIGGVESGDANTAIKGANGVFFVWGKFTLSGGIIRGNVAPGTDNYGVYIKEDSGKGFTMSGPAQVYEDNKVFLDPRARIVIGGDLTAQPVAANIKRETIQPGDGLVLAVNQNLITNNRNKFLYDGESGHIKLEDVLYNDDGDLLAGVYYQQ